VTKFSNRYYYAEAYDVMERLAESVARPGMIAVDVGCLDGSSAFRMLPTVKQNGGTAFLVDWFRGSDGTVVGEDWRPETFPTADVIARLIDNLRMTGFDKLAVIVAAHSNLAAKVIADGTVDYCFVAADHRYTPAKRDIEAWWPKVRSGGILAGHAFEMRIEPHTEAWQAMMNHCEQDIANNAHYGVIRAVQESFTDFEFEASVWWARKP